MNNICECLIQLPSVQNILNIANTKNSVCTNTQCFDNYEDAGFELITYSQNTNELFVVITYICMSYLVIRNIRHDFISLLRQWK